MKRVKQQVVIELSEDSEALQYKPRLWVAVLLGLVLFLCLAAMALAVTLFFAISWENNDRFVALTWAVAVVVPVLFVVLAYWLPKKRRFNRELKLEQMSASAGPGNVQRGHILEGVTAPGAQLGSIGDIYLQRGQMMWGPKKSDGWGQPKKTSAQAMMLMGGLAKMQQKGLKHG